MVYLISFIFIVFLLILLKEWDWNHNDAILANIFSLRLVSMYFPFYVFGMCCKEKESFFHRIINNEYFIAIIIITFVLGLLKQNGVFYFGLIMGFLGFIILYRLVFFYQRIFSSNTILGNQLCIIGRYTLPIYLIHYFFYLGLKLPKISNLIDIHTQWGLIAIIALFLSLVIVYLSLAITKLLTISKPLSSILIGNK